MEPRISIIVATFNRASSLDRLLKSIARQDFPSDSYEVVIVDDGSSDETREVARGNYGFAMRYYWQSNQGGTCAKNFGAAMARGYVLQFIDDDIDVADRFLREIWAAHQQFESVVVVGNLVHTKANGGVMSDTNAEGERRFAGRPAIEAVGFADCAGGFFSVKASSFLDLGGLAGVGASWPNWEDVDFGYKAHRKGYSFLRANYALGVHYDFTLNDIEVSARRWERAAMVAPLLFRRHPHLRSCLPMFRDKLPVSWLEDPPKLMLRKIARYPASSVPVVLVMKIMVRLLEQRKMNCPLVQSLQRWIIGAYIFRGFRQGLKEYGGLAQ